MRYLSTNTQLITVSFFFFLLSTVDGLGQERKQLLNSIEASPEFFEKMLRIKKLESHTQMDSLRLVTEYYCLSNKDTCLLLTDHIVAVAKTNKYRLYTAHALLIKGKNILRYVNDSIGREIMITAKDIYEKEGRPRGMCRVEAFLASTHFEKGNLKEAVDHSLLSLELAEIAKDTQFIIKSLIVIGGAYFQMGGLDKTIYYLEEAGKYSELFNVGVQQVEISANKAAVYKRMGSNYSAMADIISTDISLYRDSARTAFQKGLVNAEAGYELAKKLNIPGAMVGSITILNALNNKLGNYRATIAKEKETLELAENIKAPRGIAANKATFANAHFELGNFKKSLLLAEPALQLAKANKLNSQIDELNSLLYKVYKATGNIDKALPIVEEINKLEKEKSKSNLQKAIADAETKYQTSQKEKQILQLEIKNAKIAKQRNYIMAGGLMFSLLGFFGYRVNQLQKERNEKIAFAEALIFAQEEERKRIGRDLHDGVGQSLLLIKKQLAATTEVTVENQKMIAETLEEVRSISRDLHPFQLEKIGLTKTINYTLLKIGESTDLFITDEIDNIDNALHPNSEIHLYRTIQEAFNNIIKHAEATAAKITVQNLADTISVIVQDNGKGFDPELATATSKSLGIRTMHERIAAIGGTLKIEKGTDGGTRINITIPKKK